MPGYLLRVFVSATTGDLASARKAAAAALLKRDLLPVTQEYLAPDERTIPVLLRDKIAGCDAVICLVGNSSASLRRGAIPNRAPTRSSSTTLPCSSASRYSSS
jgi:hypothetical protein